MAVDPDVVIAKKATERLERLGAQQAEQARVRREAVTHLRSRGWSMQMVADAIGVSKTAVAQIVHGDSRQPKARQRAEEIGAVAVSRQRWPRGPR